MLGPVYQSIQKCCFTAERYSSLKLQCFQWCSLFTCMISHTLTFPWWKHCAVSKWHEDEPVWVSLITQMVMKSSDLHQHEVSPEEGGPCCASLARDYCRSRANICLPHVSGAVLSQLIHQYHSVTLSPSLPLSVKQVLPGTCTRCEQCKENMHRTEPALKKPIPIRLNLKRLQCSAVYKHWIHHTN